MSHGPRKFFELEILSAENKGGHDPDGVPPFDVLAASVKSSIVGCDTSFLSPYGRRQVVYADYIASGRATADIERYITSEVLPLYANTHTTTTVTALQTTRFRLEARDIIRNATNASENDAVIFVGAGVTGAIHKLVNGLEIARAASLAAATSIEPPTVLVGPYEHHSNILPWRDAGARVLRVRESPAGGVDLVDLESKLRSLTGSQLVVGAFSAASNVTGILCDPDPVSAVLHAYGALAVWDYATAGPYTTIDMNPPGLGCHKDAIVISPHKFVGGVGAAGVLVAKKTVLRNPVPNGGGGGSVFFVTQKDHRYLKDVETREEGGTPDIVGSIRSGLAFQLKQAAGADRIMAHELRVSQMAYKALQDNPRIKVLGSASAPRLAIMSFVVETPVSGIYLHHNFVSSLLNDLFGIQARGGCACAGPYALDLLGLNEDLAVAYETALLEDDRLDRHHLRRGHAEHSERELLRPGFVRVSFPWFEDDETVKYILAAIDFIGTHGWKFLVQYTCNSETAEWRHHHHTVLKERRWLGHINYSTGRMKYRVAETADEAEVAFPATPSECLATAAAHVAKIKASPGPLLPDVLLDASCEHLRWFLSPADAHRLLINYEAAAAMLRPAPFCIRQNHSDNDCDLNLSRVPCTKSNFSVHLSEDSLSVSIANRKPELLDVPNVSTRGQEDHQSQLNKQDPQYAMLEEIARLRARLDELEVGHEEQIRMREVSSLVTSSSGQKNGDAAQNTKSCIRPIIPVTAMVASLTEDTTLRSVSGDDKSTNGLPHTTSNSGAFCMRPVHQKEIDSRWCKTNIKDGRKQRTRFQNPSKEIFKPTITALEQFIMIKDGDKVLVCVSGGKDSLSLLHTLKQYQHVARKKGVNFKIGAATVDPGTEAFDPSPLKSYMTELGVEYYYENQSIITMARAVDPSSICSFCSRMKRGRLYNCARREGFNVLAFGHHLDDLAESFLMGAFHNGFLRTMKANYTVAEGDLRVIRPFVYVRERAIRAFSEASKLPVIAENCPGCFEAPKERHRMKQLLASQELLFPKIFGSLQGALHPLMSVQRTGEQSTRKSSDADRKQVTGEVIPQTLIDSVMDEDELDFKEANVLCKGRVTQSADI